VPTSPCHEFVDLRKSGSFGKAVPSKKVNNYASKFSILK
jgi:hypothetical protein